MTIERLEELKNTLYEALHYQENFRDLSAEEQMEKDVNKLIDAEIERQSVTDEEIKGAIGLMEWCKGQAEDNDPIASGKEIADAIKKYNLAIQALKEYQLSRNPEQLEKVEQLGCECKRTVLLNGTAYCANCGRKL